MDFDKYGISMLGVCEVIQNAMEEAGGERAAYMAEDKGEEAMVAELKTTLWYKRACADDPDVREYSDHDVLAQWYWECASLFYMTGDVYDPNNEDEFGD